VLFPFKRRAHLPASCPARAYRRKQARAATPNYHPKHAISVNGRWDGPLDGKQRFCETHARNGAEKSAPAQATQEKALHTGDETVTLLGANIKTRLYMARA